MTLTQEKIDKMLKLRSEGCSYTQIERMVGVSRWSTINYLKDMPLESGNNNAWKEIQDETPKYLKKQGFSRIIDLNIISNTNSTWDFYAEKNGKKYLIDTTIDDRKAVRKKIENIPQDYVGIILYYDFQRECYIPYRLVEGFE